MIIFGSGTIVQQLIAKGLIDDYYFVVTPDFRSGKIVICRDRKA
jgi:dihydrofolate reductase